MGSADQRRTPRHGSGSRSRGQAAFRHPAFQPSLAPRAIPLSFFPHPAGRRACAHRRTRCFTKNVRIPVAPVGRMHADAPAARCADRRGARRNAPDTIRAHPAVPSLAADSHTGWVRAPLRASIPDPLLRDPILCSGHCRWRFRTALAEEDSVQKIALTSTYYYPPRVKMILVTLSLS